MYFHNLSESSQKKAMSIAYNFLKEFAEYTFRASLSNIGLDGVDICYFDGELAYIASIDSCNPKKLCEFLGIEYDKTIKVETTVNYHGYGYTDVEDYSILIIETDKRKNCWIYDEYVPKINEANRKLNREVSRIVKLYNDKLKELRDSKVFDDAANRYYVNSNIEFEPDGKISYGNIPF